jgi:hypothetical protein
MTDAIEAEENADMAFNGRDEILDFITSEIRYALSCFYD